MRRHGPGNANDARAGIAKRVSMTSETSSAKWRVRRRYYSHPKDPCWEAMHPSGMIHINWGSLDDILNYLKRHEDEKTFIPKRPGLGVLPPVLVAAAVVRDRGHRG